MVLENLVIPFQINNKIKGTIVRLSSVASQIINNEYPRNINSIFADAISITASIGSRMKNDGVFSFQAHSEGVIKTIFVDLNNNSSVRGYISVNNFENIEHLPFEKLISNGTLALNIKEGKTTIIMGKNGSGKSTLLRLLNQIIKPSSGFFESNLPKPVPMLFQKPLILQNSVIYNYQILKQIKKHQINNTWFEKFDLLNLSNQKMNSLSEGEKQKIFISRIMSFDQSQLFLDEPNQSLDLQSEKLLIDLLIKEKKEKTIIMTLHDFEIAKKIGDYFIYLENGKILLQDNYEDFFIKFPF